MAEFAVIEGDGRRTAGLVKPPSDPATNALVLMYERRYADVTAAVQAFVRGLEAHRIEVHAFAGLRNRAPIVHDYVRDLETWLAKLREMAAPQPDEVMPPPRRWDGFYIGGRR